MIFSAYIHDCGLYVLFVYHLYMYLRGFPSYILYVYHFKRGVPCICRGIDLRVMHAHTSLVLDSYLHAPIDTTIHDINGAHLKLVVWVELDSMHFHSSYCFISGPFGFLHETPLQG